MMKQPVTLCLCYAQKDERLCKELKNHLSSLRQQRLISAWDDQCIVAGTDRAKAINEQIERASIILLLISPDFLASDFCYQVEMRPALARHDAGRARVIPVVLRPVDWSGFPFAHLQALPSRDKAITQSSNRDQAFKNVAAGVRRAIEDLSLLEASASHAALPRIWSIPYPRNSFFINRDKLLSHLRSQLQAGRTMALSQPQACSGLGGIGKTQIAVEYAYRYRQEYDVVLWAPAESEETLISSYTTIAMSLGLPKHDAEAPGATIQVVKAWLQQTHEKWLLILDNADGLELLPPFLPSAPAGHILLTTCAWNMGRLAQRIEVEVLSDEEGALFLLRRAGLLAPDAPLEQTGPEEQALAIQLAHLMGGLPLALDQAGAYLEATGMSLQEYLRGYQQRRPTLLDERRSHVPDHPLPVTSTLSLSFEKVEKKNPPAADLLRLCACLSADAIPEEIITQGAPYLGPLLEPVAADPFLLAQAIEALRAYSLLNRDPRTQTLLVHRLVQAVRRDSIDAETQKVWRRRAVLAVNAAFPKVKVATWPQCEQLLPHVLTCADWIQEEDMAFPEAARLLNEAGYFLDQHGGQYIQAQQLYQRAMAIYERFRGAESPDVASLSNNLAILSKLQGEPDTAKELYRNSLRIWWHYESVKGAELAQSLNNLGVLYAEQYGKYETAERLFKYSLCIWEQLRERSLEPDPVDAAWVLNNLANLYTEWGRKYADAESQNSFYREAENWYKQSITILEQSKGPDYIDIAYPSNGLGTLYCERGEYEKAEKCYERSLRIWKHYLGPKHPQVAYAFHNLAVLYTKQGKYENAEEYYKDSLNIWHERLSPKHRHTRTCAKNYASLLRSQGRDDKAQALEKKYLSSD